MLVQQNIAKVIFLSVLFVFLLCCGSDNTKTDKTENQAKLQKFYTYSYIDPMVGIEVFRFLIPGDWKAEGAIKWEAVPALPARVNFRFYDTKSLSEFNLFPTQDYFWTDNQMFLYTNPPGSLRFGTPVAQPIDLHTAFTRVIIPKFRGEVSDLELVEEKEVPELVKLAKGPPTQGVTALAEAGKMRIEYNENGKEMEEEFYAAVSQFIINLPGSYYSPGYYINYWYIDLIFSFKAEKGRLDAQTKLFQTMLYSFKVNPQWYAKVANVKEQLAQMVIQNIQAVGRMSQIITQASSEMREDQQRSWEYRQEINDKIAQNFSDYVRGVDQYYDPFAEKRVELPTGYKNVYSNNLGEYILTDDPNYNPNVGSNLTWQKLDLAK